MMGAFGYVFTTAAFAYTIDMRLAGVMGVSMGFFLLVAMRGLYSLTSGAIYPATMAMVGDMTSREHRAAGVAMISAAWGLGSVVGPAIAAAFSSFSPTAPFYVVTLMGVAMVAFYVFYLHEPDRHREPEKNRISPHHDRKSAQRRRRLLPFDPRQRGVHGLPRLSFSGYLQFRYSRNRSLCRHCDHGDRFRADHRPGRDHSPTSVDTAAHDHNRHADRFGRRTRRHGRTDLSRGGGRHDAIWSWWRCRLAGVHDRRVSGSGDPKPRQHGWPNHGVPIDWFYDRSHRRYDSVSDGRLLPLHPVRQSCSLLPLSWPTFFPCRRPMTHILKCCRFLRSFLLLGVCFGSAHANEAQPPTFQDCSRCPVMVALPAGSFTMGDINPPKEDEPWQGERRYDRTWEQPTHLVSIATPFAIGRSEISRAEYTAFVEASGYMPEALCWTREDEEWLESEGRSWQNPGFEQTESEPIVCVNRSDAYAYMDWLSALTGQVYRLPSEADWEYAARAGTRTHYSWGDALGEGNANCRDCGSPWDGKKPAPIASFSPNKWGLFDMPGNVWEPALDCFHIGYGGAPSDGFGMGHPRCTFRVLRGSSWYDLGAGMRSSFRGRGTPSNRISDLGFRVVRELADETTSIEAPGSHQP